MERLEWQDQVLREMKEPKVEGRRCRAVFGGLRRDVGKALLVIFFWEIAVLKR